MRVAHGAELRTRRALGFRIEGRRLRAVRTEAGEIVADKAVIAAGAWSKRWQPRQVTACRWRQSGAITR